MRVFIELKPEGYVGGPSITVCVKKSELDQINRYDLERKCTELLKQFFTPNASSHPPEIHGDAPLVDPDVLRIVSANAEGEL